MVIDIAMDTELHKTYSEEETVELGKRFAHNLEKGDVVALYGELGAGKTEFVKGICEYFHVEEIVSSPTFTIMNQYTGENRDHDEITLYHVDLYRIDSSKELQEIGFNECTRSRNAIKLIEWAEKANGSLPRERYSVIFRFNDEDDDMRIIEIRHTEEGDPETDFAAVLQSPERF